MTENIEIKTESKFLPDCDYRFSDGLEEVTYPSNLFVQDSTSSELIHHNDVNIKQNDDLNQTSGPSSMLQTDNDSDNDNESSKMPTILNGKFFKVIRSEGEEAVGSNNTVASCVKCEPNFVKIKGYKNSTSNFILHLKRRHGQESFDEYQNYKRQRQLKRKDPTSSKIVTQAIVSKQTEKYQKSFNENIIKFVIHSSVPLRVVENPYFKKIFENFHSVLVPSRRQLGREIDKLYTCHVQEAKKKLISTEYICTTVDIWSSRKCSFFGVTAHWLTAEELKRQSIALACRRLKETRSFDRIAVMMNEIHLEYGISKKQLVATVTDNESNFVKAFEAFGVKKGNSVYESQKDAEEQEDTDSNEEDEEEEMTNISADSWNKTIPNHIRCSSHTLNLCVLNDFKRALLEDVSIGKLHEEVMAKCNVLWRASKSSKSSENFERLLGYTFNRPGKTQWNSVFDSLNQIWKSKEKMSVLVKELNIKKCLKEHEFHYISEYLQCTEPLANALNILQSEENIYFGILLPCILSLQHKLKTLKSKSWMYCQPIANVLYESVTTRFQDLLTFDTLQSETAVIAALTYPRFKNRWFSLICPELHQRLLDLLKREVMSENEKTKNTVIENNHSHANLKDDDFFDFPTSSKDLSATETLLPTGELEILKYLCDHDVRLECLEKYPTIRKLFVKFNTPIPSSTSVEKLFSYATIVNLSNSNKFSDSMFEKMAILKSNLNFLSAI